MATFPSIHSALLEIHQSLGLKQAQTNAKRKFATGRMQLKNQEKMGEQLLADIFGELALDMQAQHDFLQNLKAMSMAYKQLELSTWTFNADSRQVFWMLLGYFFIPCTARHAAYWNVPSSLDRGMPRSSFWYLPEIIREENKSRVYLPVPHVIDWISDLAGGSIDSIAEARNRTGDASGVDYTETFTRTLYNWRKGILPSRDKIHHYFSDDTEIHFSGSLELDWSQPLDYQMSDTLRFLKNKNLDDSALTREIAIRDEQTIKRIIAGRATNDEKRMFVSLVAARYEKPTCKIIRQRLLFARMVQDGYERALKFLCPGVDKYCSDFGQNKLLQIFFIYQGIYNLTVEAWTHHAADGASAEDRWFDKHLAPWDANTLFLAIAPSRRETGIIELASLLTHLFESSSPGAELPDLIGYNTTSREHLKKERIALIQSRSEEALAILKLTERLKTASPWRTLKEEKRYPVVMQVAVSGDHLSPKARAALINRLRELVKTPYERLQLILLELAGFLNGERKKLPKDSASRVEKLLAEAKSNPLFDQWKAPFLQYEAKHYLAMNDFHRSAKLFREAHRAVSERGFGSLRGEIARDSFAVEIANQKLIPDNHEIYYREMLEGGVIEEKKVPGIEDVAKWASEYFWEDLYKPYPGIKRKMPAIVDELHSSIEVLCTGDIGVIERWINLNHRKYNKGVHYVTGDSLLMSWIKLHSHTRSMQYMIEKIAPSELLPELQHVENSLEVWRYAIKLLAQKAPRQLNLKDFKGQTPLMLVTEAGDSELVQAFLAEGADPDLQDFEGRSALHSAMKSHVNESIDALLDHPCNPNLITFDGRSPLHTATWSGNKYGVEKLLFVAPHLALQRDSQGKTPLELAELLSTDPIALSYLNKELLARRRKPVQANQIEKLIPALRRASDTRSEPDEQARGPKCH